MGRFREFVAVVDHMLSHEVTTHGGRYYRISSASMLPRPIQRPRPPIMLGGKNRSLLKVAAAYADAWNTNGGRDLTPQEAFQVTRERSPLQDEYCATQGRDAQRIIRSFLVGQTRDAPFASLGAFQEFIGRYRALGFTESILFWLRDPSPGLPPPRMDHRSPDARTGRHGLDPGGAPLGLLPFPHGSHPVASQETASRLA